MMNADKTMPRSTVISLLPKINKSNTEKLLVSLNRLASRLSEHSQNTAVLMTWQQDIMAEDIQEMFIGDQQDRISAKGVTVLMNLYQIGFLTGQQMAMPKVVSRIAEHLAMTHGEVSALNYDIRKSA